ncbi:UNVERIFIED_ORG: drug/metabolite transporter superfamily protein YnfA [Rhizobium pisi]
MTYIIYAFAAVFEIAGCFAFWAWLRFEKPVWWLVPGMISLALFAWLLTLVPSEAAGRTFAALAAFIFWLRSSGSGWSKAVCPIVMISAAD